MTRRLRIDDLTAFAVPEQPALSPDGGRCVYVLRTSDADADKTVRELWCVGAWRRAAPAAHPRPGRLVARVVAGRVVRSRSCARRTGRRRSGCSRPTAASRSS